MVAVSKPLRAISEGLSRSTSLQIRRVDASYRSFLQKGCPQVMVKGRCREGYAKHVRNVGMFIENHIHVLYLYVYYFSFMTNKMTELCMEET